MGIYFQENNSIKILRALGVTIIPLAILFFPYIKDNSIWTICLYKNITGHNCYGCGLTRAVLSILHLEFSKALMYNKLIIIIFPLLTYIWTKQTIKAWKNLLPTWVSC